jgi:septum formation protein
MTLILASLSLARAAVLHGAGVPFTAIPSEVDEGALKQDARRDGLTVDATALLLARHKAMRVGAAHPEAIVLGADQILLCEGLLYDKPRDRSEARRHLCAFRGRAHALVTAMVAVRRGAPIWSYVTHAKMVMRNFSDRFLDHYLEAEGSALLGSLGAYRIEGMGIQLFAEVAADREAILGLPLLPLLAWLREAGEMLA